MVLGRFKNNNGNTRKIGGNPGTTNTIATESILKLSNHDQTENMFLCNPSIHHRIVLIHDQNHGIHLLVIKINIVGKIVAIVANK